MIKNLNLEEGQEDLRIVEHLNMQKLPESVQQMLSLASTPEEQDIILMATLAAASACVPNLYFTYGPTGKKYYANLQCFILAAAYRLIDGDTISIVPDIKPLDQRRVLFDQLKPEYNHKELISEAKSQGVSVRTAERWNLNWIADGIVQKWHHGEYKKVG